MISSSSLKVITNLLWALIRVCSLIVPLVTLPLHSVLHTVNIIAQWLTALILIDSSHHALWSLILWLLRLLIRDLGLLTFILVVRRRWSTSRIRSLWLWWAWWRSWRLLWHLVGDILLLLCLILIVLILVILLRVLIILLLPVLWLYSLIATHSIVIIIGVLVVLLLWLILFLGICIFFICTKISSFWFIIAKRLRRRRSSNRYNGVLKGVLIALLIWGRLIVSGIAPLWNIWIGAIFRCLIICIWSGRRRAHSHSRLRLALLGLG